MLDPDFTSELQRDFFKEACDLAIEIAEDYGTGLVEKAAEIRRRMVTTRDQLVSLAERLKSEQELAIDLETFPTIQDFKKKDVGDTRKADVRLISISTPSGESTLVDLVSLQQDLEPLRTVLETKRIIGHNLQFEYGFLWDKYGIELKGGMFDTLLAAHRCLLIWVGGPR